MSKSTQPGILQRNKTSKSQIVKSLKIFGIPKNFQTQKFAKNKVVDKSTYRHERVNEAAMVNGQCSLDMMIQQSTIIH